MGPCKPGITESRLSDGGRFNIRDSALRIANEVSQNLSEATTRRSRDATSNIRNRFLARWLRAAARFRKGLSSLGSGVGQAYIDARDNLVGELESEWHESMRDAVIRGWSLGYESRGGARAGSLSVDEIFKLAPHLRTQLNRYFEYASRFAHELSDGIPDRSGRMPFGIRSEQYARAINGAYTQGAVDGGPPGEYIVWVLGANERSCGDCPALAAISAERPFTRETLPTTPGQGETECLHNCRCHLVFVRGQSERVVMPDVYAEILDPDNVPPGKRAPTAIERAVVSDLRLRTNYARRIMSEFDQGSPEFKKWSAARVRLGQRLADYEQPRGIVSLPIFDVPEVITGRHIAADDVRKILSLGIDGRTAGAISISEADASLEKASSEVRKLLSDVGAPEAMPVVPNIAARSIEFEESFDLGNGEPFGIKQIDPSMEFSPDPTGRWTVNISGLGLQDTMLSHIEFLRMAIEADTPYFIQIAPYYGEDWAKIVAITGSWIKGPAEEVQRFMVDARERFGVRATGYAPFLQGV